MCLLNISVSEICDDGASNVCNVWSYIIKTYIRHTTYQSDVGARHFFLSFYLVFINLNMRVWRNCASTAMGQIPLFLKDLINQTFMFLKSWRHVSGYIVKWQYRNSKCFKHYEFHKNHGDVSLISTLRIVIALNKFWGSVLKIKVSWINCRCEAMSINRVRSEIKPKGVRNIEL